MRRIPISGSQLAELIGVDDPMRLFAVVRVSATGWEVLLEEQMQTTGTCPPLSDNTGKRKPKGGKK